MDYEPRKYRALPSKGIISRRYTESELVYLKKNINTVPIPQMALDLNRTYHSVYGKLRREGLIT